MKPRECSIALRLILLMPALLSTCMSTLETDSGRNADTSNSGHRQPSNGAVDLDKTLNERTEIVSKGLESPKSIEAVEANITILEVFSSKSQERNDTNQFLYGDEQEESEIQPTHRIPSPRARWPSAEGQEEILEINVKPKSKRSNEYNTVMENDAPNNMSIESMDDLATELSDNTFDANGTYCIIFLKPRGQEKDIVVLALSFLGISCIVLTMVVLTRKSMRTSCNSYLTALALSDLIFLSLLISNRLMEILEDCYFYASAEGTSLKYYTYTLMGIFLNLTVGITVMLGFERYIAICRPMRAMTMCTVKRARICIAIIACVAIILQSPKFLDLHFSYAKLKNNETRLTVSHNFIYDNRIYCYIVTCSIVTLLPLMLLIILTARIIYEIRKSARYLQVFLGADWQVRSVVSSEELKITMMLMSVIVVFFICHVPYMVYNLLMALSDFTSLAITSSPMWIFAIAVAQSLVALKALCNLILYCWLSDKFWATFKRTFRRFLQYTRTGNVAGRRQMHQTSSSNHSDLNSVHSQQNCQVNSNTKFGAGGNKRRIKWQQQPSSNANFSRSSYLTKEATC